MNRDVILNKSESIQRCIKQAREYYQMSSEILFEEDHLKQDAILMNIQRACEQSIDLANHKTSIFYKLFIDVFQLEQSFNYPIIFIN